jgi:Ca2+-binding EF-hand superfamily protein
MSRHHRHVSVTSSSSAAQGELKVAATNVDRDGNGSVVFADFLALVAKRVADSESPSACVSAFKVASLFGGGHRMTSCCRHRCDPRVAPQVFDKENNGFVTVAEFRNIMTSA